MKRAGKQRFAARILLACNVDKLLRIGVVACNWIDGAVWRQSKAFAKIGIQNKPESIHG